MKEVLKMNGPMKNIDKAQVLVLRDQVAYQDGQIVSKTWRRTAM